METYKDLIFLINLAYVNQFRPVRRLSMKMSNLRSKTGRGYILAHDFSIQIDPCQLNQITCFKQYINLAARESWGTSRKSGIRVNQGDNRKLTPLVVSVCQQTTRGFVGGCG